jgi:hypothetical protein
MKRSIATGAAFGALIACFTLSARMAGPSQDEPGYAYAKILGVTVDYLEIPPAANRQPLPTDRIMKGYMATFALAVAIGAVIGGAVGWGVAWRKDIQSSATETYTSGVLDREAENGSP